MRLSCCSGLGGTSLRDLASLDDRELVCRAKARDTNAFGQLVERYQPQLVRLCNALTADVDLAEELVQITWAKAFEAIDHVREGERFFGWLRQIAINQLRDSWRRRRLPQIALDQAAFNLPDQAAGPADTLLEHERREEMWAALAALSAHDRQILALRFEQDLSYREIAAQLHTTEGTVATWLYRAKERLRGAMEKKGGHPL